MSRMLDRNRPGEVHTKFHYDEADDRIITERVQDVEPILKQNARLRSGGDGYSEDKSIRHVGQIPLVMIEKIMREEGWDPMHPDNVKELHALLDRPDYQKFRTSEGRISSVALRTYVRGSTARLIKDPKPKHLSAKPHYGALELVKSGESKASE